MWSKRGDKTDTQTVMLTSLTYSRGKISNCFHSVRVTWEDVFPKGRGCNDVEFLIKSHPLDSPSNYKLSDLTLKGKRSATLAVPQGEDFIFQVDSKA